MHSLSETILFESFNQVKTLIEEGADLNEQDEYGYTPLIEAVISEKIDIVDLLLKKGARVDGEDISGCTALQWASDYNHLELCQLLLQFKANPNHYSADGQPILVNPILRKQQAIIDLFAQFGADLELPKDYISAKLIGHRFELSGQADLVDADGNFFEIEFEGFFLEFTLGLIQRSFWDFCQDPISQSYDAYTVYSQKLIKAFINASAIMQRKFAKRTNLEALEFDDLFKEDLLMIPVTYQGHAITLIKWGNLFAKCDRGVNKITDTVIVYQMKNSLALTNELLKELIIENKPDYFINTELKKILNLKPLITIPTKSQLAGNCSWANVEAAIPAMLYMILLQGKELKNDLIAGLKKQVMTFFNTWVEWDKDRALEECIAEFHNANRAKKAAKAAILASILIQRCSHLKPLQIARAKKILPILRLPDYRYILKSYISVYISKRAGKLGENFKKLLELCGMNIATLELEDINTKNKNIAIKINFPLHIAARRGDLNLMKDIMHKMKVSADLKDETGSTPLMYAAWMGHFEMVKYLVEIQHADSSIRNHKNGLAIQYAMYNNHLAIVKYLANLK
ncbi:MAG: arp [Francisellaceae bacterium]|nr:arp [Francisellaceae bacterium]